MADAPHAAWRDMEFRDVERVLRKVRQTPGFFENLHPFPGTRTLVQSIHNIAGGYSILSSPLAGAEERCAEEKIRWIEKHLHLDPVDIIITSDKPKYAEGNILIDDYGLNIRKWEEAGGFGIKYQADEQHMSDVLVPLMAMFKKGY